MQHEEIRARIARIAAELNKLTIELEELGGLIDNEGDVPVPERPCPLRVIRGGNAA